MSLLPVAEAMARLLDGVAALPSEKVRLGEAGGRVLAEPVAALRTHPPFSASAMDGYAVRAADLNSPPAVLKIIGEVAAGHGFPGTLGVGECVRIFTGAPVPRGADAVLIQEDTVPLLHGQVRALAAVEPGRNIRQSGQDFVDGQPLLEAGRELDPAALSLAAAANHPFLRVIRRPRVAILATGDELVLPGTRPGPGQIIASNGFGIAALVASAGGEPLDLGIAPDRREAIADGIRKGLALRADIVVTIGGASVGDHDLVGEVLRDLGVALSFWKIAMRPGKPLMAGRLRGTHMLGLPGNPVSALVCARVFLVPLITRLAGRQANAALRQARLACDMAANGERQDYVRARVVESPTGLVATPFTQQDSSMLRVLAASNGLIVRQPHAPASRQGDVCQLLMLREPEPGPALKPD